MRPYQETPIKKRKVRKYAFFHKTNEIFFFFTRDKKRVKAKKEVLNTWKEKRRKVAKGFAAQKSK